MLARKLLRERDAAVEQFGKPGVIERRLRIGVTELTAMTWLPRLVGLVRAHYPKVTLEPDVDGSLPLRDKLLADALDVIIVPDAFGDSRLPAKPVGQVESAWMCRPGLVQPPAPGRPVRLHDLAAHRLLVQGNASGTGRIYDGWMRERGVEPADTLVVSNLIALAGLTISGLGVSYLPRHCLAPWSPPACWTRSTCSHPCRPCPTWRWCGGTAQRAGGFGDHAGAVVLRLCAGVPGGRRHGALVKRTLGAPARRRLQPGCAMDADRMVASDGPVTMAGAAFARRPAGAVAVHVPAMLVGGNADRAADRVHRIGAAPSPSVSELAEAFAMSPPRWRATCAPPPARAPGSGPGRAPEPGPPADREQPDAGGPGRAGDGLYRRYGIAAADAPRGGGESQCFSSCGGLAMIFADPGRGVALFAMQRLCLDVWRRALRGFDVNRAVISQ